MTDTQLEVVRQCLGSLADEGRLPANFSPAGVKRHLSIDSLGIDSLGKAEFLLELEKLCTGVLLNEDAEAIRTIDDLCSRLPGAPRAPQKGAVDPPAVDSREGSLSDYTRARSPDLFAKVRDFTTFLEDLRRRGDEQYLLPVTGYNGSRAAVRLTDGPTAQEKEVIAYCSANYLGLSFHSSVKQSVQTSVRDFGTSAASVPLIAGSTSLHFDLQRRLADFLGTEDVVLFPTGHAANLGTISALVGPRDVVVVDKQVHYSILEGVRLTSAQWMSFRHSDVSDLTKTLRSAREKHPDSGILVVVEGVYGIDGDVAPLPELIQAARGFGARLMVDDAHATGVLGPRGAGSIDHHRLESAPDIVMGSLSKSLGSMGGWIATDSATADYLRYFSKTIVFSVGLPAINIAAAMESLRLIEQDPQRIRILHRRVQLLKDGLLNLGLTNAAKSESSIVSVLVGDERTLRDVVRDLFDDGIWVEGLPFPAVTRGSERIRFRVTTLHTEEDIQQTIASVGKVFKRHGLVSGRASAALTTHRPESAERETAELARLAATQHQRPLSWLTRDFYESVLTGGDYWDQGQPRRLFVRRRDGDVVAACLATVSKVGFEGEPREVGLIGHLHWLPSAMTQLRDAVLSAVDWLEHSTSGPLFAPIQSPLPILGGGVVPSGTAVSGPFLEPAVHPDCARVLRDLGFQTHSAHEYRLASLLSARAHLGEPVGAPETGLRFRCLRRAHLKKDVAALLPAFNGSIGKIELCAPLGEELFYGIARDLRELILPELWQIAELDGRVVGFVGAFPEVGTGFQRAAGDAGIADLSQLQDVVDQTRRGFVAWLAVDPRHGGKGIGKHLLRRVYREMQRKGYQDTFLSWEMRDGDLTEIELAPDRSLCEEHIEYQIFRRDRSGSGGAVINARAELRRQ